MKILATLLLLLLTPLSAFLALLIYFPNRTNVLFTQKRVGRNREEFTIYKFKTMEDNQVTVIGRYIRKLGLDEIPQLINIIKGEMAFIGPRPLTSADVERLGWVDTKYDSRWKVKPGITGMAQLTKICDANVSMENDLFYVNNQSLGLDFKIIGKTFLVPLLGKRTK